MVSLKNSVYENTKIMVCLHYGDKDFFNIVTGVLQEGTLAQYKFTICLNYILQTSIDLIKENSFTLKKTRSRHILLKIMTETDFAADLVLLANTPVKAESLLYSLEQAVGGLASM